MNSKLDDITVTYRASGQGEPVVMVHGLAQDHTMWQVQQDELTDYATYAYDVRGFGASTVGSARGTLEQLGEDLVNFLREISGPAHVVGFSLGGTIALWAAATHSELVRSAVVLGTSSVVGRSAAEFYASRIKLKQSGDDPAFREALKSDTAGALTRGTVDLGAQTDYRVTTVGHGDGYINASRAMARINQDPLTAVLAKVSCPVAVIGAEKDSFCPRKAADILLEALPHAQYIEIPAAGHLMVEEAPAESTEAIRSFLATHSSTTKREEQSNE